MGRYLRTTRMTRWGVLPLLCAVASHASGAEATVFRTNRLDRWITNVIEVRIPANHFANEYRTNWIEQWNTNLVDVYATNHATLLLTNEINVVAFTTNWIPSYRTNWQNVTLTNQVALEAFQTNFVQRYQTNWVALYHTNWKSVALTNELMLDRFQTNFQVRYQTNWRTLSLTNWETALVFKTNWITRPISNVVEIEMAGPPPATTEPSVRKAETPAPSRPSAPSPVASASSARWSDDLSLEASIMGQPQANHPIQVRLGVTWHTDAADSLRLHQWRVEREGGSILCFGQEPEFHRELPVGNYNVEVKVRHGTDGPMLAAHGVVQVTPTGAVMQQKLAAAR